MLEEIIRRVWYGREKLWKVFWLYKVLIGIVLASTVDLLAKYGFKTITNVVLAFYVAFHIWVLKGLYACRFNSQRPNLTSKLVLLLLVVNIAFLLLGIFAFLTHKSEL